MRIGVLTSLYPSPPRPREGIFAERRWRTMAERGHELQVVHPQPRVPLPFVAGPHGQWAELRAMPASELRHGIPIQRPRYLHLPGRALGNARRFAARGVASLLRAGWQPEVCVLDYAWPASAAVPALAARGVPTIVSGRGSDVLQVAGEAGLGGALGAFLASSSGWCAVSSDLVAAMDALAGAAGRGRLVPNGVDTERFRPSDRAAARRRLALRAEGPLVLVVGHLIARKDPLLALAAFRAAALEDARLVFVGRGPLAAELQRAAADLGQAVALVGECEPALLADWYAAADCLLLTSSREGRPNVVLEALAAGRPVLATDAGGTRELLEGLPGMLADTRDPRRLGAALAELLRTEHDPQALAAHVAPLSWEASADALEALLDGAASSPRP